MKTLAYWKQIENDLDWRESELSLLKLVFRQSRKKANAAMLRCLLAMLYAHYEGFCKNAIAVYAQAICNLGKPTKLHIDPLVLTALKSVFKKVKIMSDAQLLEFIRTGFGHVNGNSIVIDVREFKTNNLTPEILEELCNKVGLQCSELKNNHTILKTLVGRRNDIAHGEESTIDDIDEYIKYEEAAFRVMYDLSSTIKDSLKTKAFIN